LAKYIPVNIFSSLKKSLQVLAGSGRTNEGKVNWSFSKFVTTSREQTWCKNVRIVCKSLPESEGEKKYILGQNFTPRTLIPAKYIQRRGHREWVKL
jgi:hypothetical protein